MKPNTLLIELVSRDEGPSRSARFGNPLDDAITVISIADESTPWRP